MQVRWIAAGLRLMVAMLTALLAVTGVPVHAQNNTPAEEPPPTFDKSYLTSSTNIEAGREVWEVQCRHCHGKSAYPGKAPKLNPGAYTPDFVYDRVTYGFRGMPPWKAVFTLEQRKAVVAYVKSDNFSP